MPFAADEFTGVTVIELNVAAVTVKLVVPLIVPRVAVIVTAPRSAAVAIPCVPDELLIDAIESFEDDHVTEVVRFCVELSV